MATIKIELQSPPDGTPLRGLGIKPPRPSDIERLEALRGSRLNEPAIIFGNGWRLRLARGNVRPGFVTIGTNRSHEVFDAEYHVNIDRATEAPSTYAGIRFGAAREGRHPDTLGAYWSDYWKTNGMAVPKTSPPFTGLYAIEVALFLGCSTLYLLGFCGDDKPGTIEGHFYEGKRCAPGLAAKHNEWIQAAVKARPGLQVLSVLVPGTPPPAIHGTGVVQLTDIIEASI